jgi:hypothetical protein
MSGLAVGGMPPLQGPISFTDSPEAHDGSHPANFVRDS